MAKTAGQIDAGDGAPDFGEVYSYQGIAYRLPPQCEFWANGYERHLLEWHRQHTIAAATTVTERVSITQASAVLHEETTTGPKVAVWDDMDGTYFPAIPMGIPMPTFSGSGTPPAYSIAVHSGVLDSGTNAEVLCVAVELDNTEAFGTPAPSQSATYEIFGSNYDTASTGWSPFSEHEPASAWLGQVVLSKNQNRLLYESRQAWSTPL